MLPLFVTVNAVAPTVTVHGEESPVMDTSLPRRVAMSASSHWSTSVGTPLVSWSIIYHGSQLYA